MSVSWHRHDDVARHTPRTVSWLTKLWPILIVFDILGFFVVAWLLPYSLFSAPRLYAFLSVVILVTTCLAAIPIIRFLDTGWQIRYDEIRNKLPDGRLRAYLERFWRLRVAAEVGASPNEVNPKLSLPQANALFLTLYEEQYGRTAFVTPLALLVITVFLEAVMVVVTERGVLNFGIIQSDTIRTAVAAVAGAYLFVVVDTVARVRWRSLNIADIYGYVLRMVVAVPIGMSISLAAAPALGALVAFGAAGLPLNALIQLFQRLSYKTLDQPGPEEVSDELIALEGVTSAIAVSLKAEGVNSIDQLLCIDPVLLTIRTGLPFDLILRFAAQAITGRYLTGPSAALLPLGLGDAPAIAALVAQLSSKCGTKKAEAQNILNDAVQRLRNKDQPASPTTDLVEFQFRRIAEDSYTKLFFLFDQPVVS